ncbi:rod shape-determining protein RodA [Salmonella enterica subsp. salamae]|nr:rod shape-determining protein RodA [Salmonella enterica subsp. salamae]
MTDNPNKKTFWDKIHIDPTMLLILLALLVYSALVIWSASGQDIGMMERKIGPDCDGAGGHGGDGANPAARV